MQDFQKIYFGSDYMGVLKLFTSECAASACQDLQKKGKLISRNVQKS